jgi:hypothetical protein
MSDDSTAPADLSGLGLDLTEMFRPEWTKEGGQPEETSRLATSFGDDEGDRPRHGGRGPRRDDRPGRDRGPRPERHGGDRDRGPRRDGRAGPRGKEGGRRDDRGPRRHEDRGPREPAAPPPALEGWKLDLIPEPSALEGIAKQVRTRAKAYPLFELSRVILKLSDRYSVKLTALSPETPALFRAKADGSLWTSRKEAVEHMMARHLQNFYRASTVSVEPPKGAFSVIARCGMSGVLLGPPNHHEYTSKVIALHASRFRTMPFEVFKSRITMVRDEAVLEEWKVSQSTRTVYVPVVPGEEAPADTASSAPAATAEPAVTETPEETPAASTEAPVEETPATEEAVSEVAPEAPAEEAAAEASGEEVAPAVSGEKVEGFSFTEATSHFLSHHAENEIESVSGEVTLPGRVALHDSTKLLRELLLRHLRELDRFPLPLAQTLGKELGTLGLQIFKSHKKIIHVSLARPRYLDRQTTPIGENFKAILEYLEAHPNQRRDKQWNALLAIRAGIPLRPAKPAPVEGASETATESTEAAAPETPAIPAISDEEMKKHEQLLGADLLWLLHEGHAIDFAMGNLQAATPPKPQPTKKEKGPKASGAMIETLTGDLGEVQPGGSQGAEILPSEVPSDVITVPAVTREPLVTETAPALETLAPEDPGQVLPN